jgi:hypothetical protein
MRTDLAWALLGEARCLVMSGDAAGAAQRREEARAVIAALAYVPRALGREMASL